MVIRLVVCCLSPLLFTALGPGVHADSWEEEFRNPPMSARPHTWWHWMNGNVTREGITKDLEAMKRIGLGGFQAFHVTDGIPAGLVHYMSNEWREMMKHAVREADRLGLEMCFHNCAGWSSSGGPWITPDNAMYEVVWTEQRVTPGEDRISLKSPGPKLGYYRDIAAVAFPTPVREVHGEEGFRLRDADGKAGFGHNLEYPRLNDPRPDPRTAPTDAVIASDAILDLTDKMDANGRVNWQPTSGDWTVIRFGYRPTGSTNRPAPDEGRGLECDKLSRAGAEQHWQGVVQKVLDDAGPLAGKTLNNVLIDSYEASHQNWTHDFAETFQRRRGYDLRTYFPVVTGRVVDSVDVSERVLWDYRRTIADLFRDEYFGHFAELCHEQGIKLSIEPYGRPGNFHDFEVAALADIPMGEFWVERPDAWHTWSVKLAASAAHAHGRQFVGAEAFTAGQHGAAWVSHPGSLKSQGDLYFAQGLSRIIFHTYVHKPWPDSVRPGMTMGPHGMQMNRKNTWFPHGRPWIDYLARCQYLLQQGRFVADLCYVASENAPNILEVREAMTPPPPAGYDYDAISARDLMTMEVEDGHVVLPSGMRYRVLVLPDDPRVRPEVLAKVAELARAGAIVWGPRPTQSPSLQQYPECDARVEELAAEIWESNGATPATTPLVSLLESMDIVPDFAIADRDTPDPLVYLHRCEGDMHVYFVSNQSQQPISTQCLFRTTANSVQLWNPETGEQQPAAVWRAKDDGRTAVSLRLAAQESIFVVMQPAAKQPVHLAKVWSTTADRDLGNGAKIIRAAYGVLDGDETQQVDVTRAVQRLLERADGRILASNNLAGDPAKNVVKQLRIVYERDGRRHSDIVQEGNSWSPGETPAEPEPPLPKVAVRGGRVVLTSYTNDSFDILRENGEQQRVSIDNVPQPLMVEGPWQLRLRDELAASPPYELQLAQLASLSEHEDKSVRYFAGTATYRTSFDVPADRLGEDKRHTLDLGAVHVLARLELNGEPLGTLWRSPYTADVSGAVRPGANELVVHVTTLWPNRLIGDEIEANAKGAKRGLREAQIPDWLLDDTASTSTTPRYTIWRHWLASDKLLPAGLVGPVSLHTGISSAVSTE